MRTHELFNALSQSPDGVEVRATLEGVSVVTNYQPTVCGEGKTLFDACFHAASQVLQQCRDTPLLRQHCLSVLEALEHYETRTANLLL
jgi:hypothetical protein